MSSRRFMTFLTGHKAVVLIVVLGIFLFYWYEIRPIRLYRSCSTSASADARALLKSKAEIAGGSPQGASYQRLLERNMYLRSDYESFLRKCLLYYGMTPPDMQAPEDAADTANDDANE